MQLPPTMRALTLRATAPEPELVGAEVAVPRPGPGEVLVRMAASPINPNDLLFLHDRYEVKRPLPTVPGFEGSGTVVAAGGGLLARALVGRRVALTAGAASGLWSEYAVAPATQCAPLRRGMSFEQGAVLLTNPMTAFVLAAQAGREGVKAVVLTAAASALGVMLNRLFARRKIAVINVVRSEKSRAILEREGAETILLEGRPDFRQALAAEAKQRGATLALDAVGGEMTGTLIAALPERSTVRVYGMMAGEPTRVDASDLVFGSKRVEGFTMYEWVRRTSLARQLWTLGRVQRLAGSALGTRIHSRHPLSDFATALDLARSPSTAGKVLFTLAPTT